jgi:hypothetical protein
MAPRGKESVRPFDPCTCPRDAQATCGAACPEAIAVATDLERLGDVHPRFSLRSAHAQCRPELRVAGKTGPKYGAADKSGPSSYVELLPRHRDLRDAPKIRNADPLEADDSAISLRRRRRK